VQRCSPSPNYSRHARACADADLILFSIVPRSERSHRNGIFISYRYRYTDSCRITRFLPRPGTDQPDKISGCNIAGWNAASAETGPYYEGKGRHVSPLTHRHLLQSEHTFCFMTPVCWRCFSRPSALLRCSLTLASRLRYVLVDTIDTRSCEGILRRFFSRFLRDVIVCENHR